MNRGPERRKPRVRPTLNDLEAQNLLNQGDIEGFERFVRTRARFFPHLYKDDTPTPRLPNHRSNDHGPEADKRSIPKHDVSATEGERRVPSGREKAFLLGFSLGRFRMRTDENSLEVYTEALGRDSDDRKFLAQVVGPYGEIHQTKADLKIKLDPQIFSFMSNPKPLLTNNFFSSRDNVTLFFAGLLAGQRTTSHIVFHDQKLAQQVVDVFKRTYGFRLGRVESQKTPNTTYYSIPLDDSTKVITTIRQTAPVALLPDHLLNAIPNPPERPAFISYRIPVAAVGENLIDKLPSNGIVFSQGIEFRPEALPLLPTRSEKAFFRGLLPAFQVDGFSGGLVGIASDSKSQERRVMLRNVVAFWQKDSLELPDTLRVYVDEAIFDSPPSDQDIFADKDLFVPFLFGHMLAQRTLARIPSTDKRFVNDICSAFFKIFHTKLGDIHPTNKGHYAIVIKDFHNIINLLRQHPAVQSLRFFNAIFPPVEEPTTVVV